jgi:hypothetical protein
MLEIVARVQQKLTDERTDDVIRNRLVKYMRSIQFTRRGYPGGDRVVANAKQIKQQEHQCKR